MIEFIFVQIKYVFLFHILFYILCNLAFKRKILIPNFWGFFITTFSFSYFARVTAHQEWLIIFFLLPKIVFPFKAQQIFKVILSYLLPIFNFEIFCNFIPLFSISYWLISTSSANQFIELKLIELCRNSVRDAATA